MTLAAIEDHEAQAAARMLEQYRSKPLFGGLVQNLASGLQDAEDAAWQVMNGRGLDTAQGETLDNIGSVVGFDRHGLDDNTYRTVLHGVVGENYSDSTRTAVLSALKSLFQPAAVFAHNGMPGGNVGYGLVAPGINESLFPLMRTIFSRAIAGGVDVAFLQTQGAQAFSMAGPQSWVGGFGGVTIPTTNLLAPNVARGGDTLGNVSEWIPCTSGESFGTTSGGSTTTVGYLTTLASGDPTTAWEGVASIQIGAASGGPYGAKTTVTGLAPGTHYTYSYYAYDWGGFGAHVTPEVCAPSGVVTPISTSGGTAVSQFGYSRFSLTFSMPSPYTSVELRIVETLDNLYRWLVDGVQLEVGNSATAWQDPTPIVVAGGGFAALI